MSLRAPSHRCPGGCAYSAAAASGTYDAAVDPWWLLVPASYVLGGFPTAHLIGRLTGIDPLREGSGNPGASNMYRMAGRRAGAAVLAGDIAKGLVPTAIGLLAGGRPLATACGLAAMVGHVAPVLRGFRGGKGVATLGGCCLILHPLISACVLAVWVVVMRVFRVASVGSLVMAALLPIGVGLRGRPGWEVAAMTAAAAVIFVRHWSNIVRLVRNEERALS